jgi:hypothetical protein
MSTLHVPRQRVAEQQAEDTKLLQKVNHVHREAFMQKFPGQTEHCLRLIMERLHLGLDKREGVDITNPMTWRLSPLEIRDLSEAAHKLNEIRLAFPTAEEK